MMSHKEYLFSAYPELKHYNLSRQVGFDIKARDGLNPSRQYLQSSTGSAALRAARDVSPSDHGYADLGMLPVNPQKLVVLVHGGPNARDTYEFSEENAFLTNRGYAVLQVNFRGSTGLGKRLVSAGNGEVGEKDAPRHIGFGQICCGKRDCK
ncbi:hypothetical protein COOONC_04165 [Cooperia oncophora]